MEWIEKIIVDMDHSTGTYYWSVKIVDLIFSLCDINIPKRILLIFVAFYVSAKVDQNDKKVPYIEDVL